MVCLPWLVMEIYTVEEFQERWDEMITRVENGEHIGITNGKNTAVMMPADDLEGLSHIG
tara:strand:+ start:52 stop:228 length:177 start_codon:yes stop_codon:yes gene_type:complete